MQEKFYSVKELAELLKVNVRTIQRMAKDNKLQFVKKEGRVSFYKFSQNDNNSKTTINDSENDKNDSENDKNDI